MKKRLLNLMFLFLIGTIFLACSASKELIPSVAVPAQGALPVVALTSPAVGTHFNSSTVSFGGSCLSTDGNVTIAGSGLQSSTTASCTAGSFSTTSNLTLTDGNKTITVSQTNSAGTTTNSYTLIRDCPENYVLISANATLGTSSFCIAKYEMKVITNAGAPVFDGYNGGVSLDATLYKPDSRPNGIPWVKVTLPTAISECASLGTGFHLATVSEWTAMARDVESVGTNWSFGVVGTGGMFRGNSDSVIAASAVTDGYAVAGSNLLSADTGTDPYVGTGNSASDSWGAGKEQRRTFNLSSGEVIWDIGGNARDYNDVDGLGSTISYTGPGSSGTNDISSAAATSFLSSIVISGGGSFTSASMLPVTNGLTNAANTIGSFYIQSNARVGKVITRGGNFSSSNNPGVFAADFDNDTTSAGGSAGFRCVKIP